MRDKKIVIVGLRTATAKEIEELKAYYRRSSYHVKHVYQGIGFNGVLRCVKIQGC